MGTVPHRWHQRDLRQRCWVSQLGPFFTPFLGEGSPNKIDHRRTNRDPLGWALPNFRSGVLHSGHSSSDAVWASAVPPMSSCRGLEKLAAGFGRFRGCSFFQLASIWLRVFCYFPLLGFKGIYHHWNVVIFPRGLQPIEVGFKGHQKEHLRFSKGMALACTFSTRQTFGIPRAILTHLKFVGLLHVPTGSADPVDSQGALH